MKKIIAIVLCFLMTLPMAAFAEGAAIDTELEGFVTELVEGGFLMEDAELGQIMLNVDETTVLDGILAEEEIQVGQYVIVQYDGRTTRSIPPQAHADRVGCYVLNGTVGGFLDNGIMLEGDEVFGDVIVHVQGSDKHIYSGVPITVYYDGVMAMSFPGQVSARCVVVPELTGTVSDKDGEGFTLTDKDGNAYRVLIAEETLIGELVAAEDIPLTEGDEVALDGETTEAVSPAEDESSEEAEAEGAENGDDAADEPADSEDGQLATPAEGDNDEEVETDEIEKAEKAESGDEAVAETTDIPADSGEGQPASPAEENDKTADVAQSELVYGFDTINLQRELAEGDQVTVYYNGQMSRDIPAQVTALEVIVLKVVE